MTDAEWIAPGPGEWTRLADHFDRPFTAEYERIFAASFEPLGDRKIAAQVLSAQATAPRERPAVDAQSFPGDA